MKVSRISFHCIYHIVKNGELIIEELFRGKNILSVLAPFIKAGNDVWINPWNPAIARTSHGYQPSLNLCHSFIILPIMPRRMTY
jgi:hypothetical protein